MTRFITQKDQIIAQMRAELSTTIEEQWWYKTVGSTILNNNFDRKVFLQLLGHIIKTISTNPSL